MSYRDLSQTGLYAVITALLGQAELLERRAFRWRQLGALRAWNIPA